MFSTKIDESHASEKQRDKKLREKNQRPEYVLYSKTLNICQGSKNYLAGCGQTQMLDQQNCWGSISENYKL